MPAPIALFAFNRPDHLRRTLEALAANELAAESELTIFCDGPRREEEKALTDAVHSVADRVTGFRSVRIVVREYNLGCASSIISGLEEMFSCNERVITIEDDVVCSALTLKFLNTGLERYQTVPTVFNISAWSPPAKTARLPHSYPFDVYFIPRFNCSGGWASWRDRWVKIDWGVSDYATFVKNPCLQKAFNQGGSDLTAMLADQMANRLDAWDIRMEYARFKHGCVGLNPVYSYTTNIGMGSGTHTTTFTTRFDNDLSLAVSDPLLPDHVFVDQDVLRAYRKVYAPPRLSVRAVNKGWRMLFGKNLIEI